MSKSISDVIKALPDLLPLKPVTNQQITDAELQLRVSFDDEFKAYVKEFGAIMAEGIELTGITKSEYRNVVSITQRERGLNPNVPNTMYVNVFAMLVSVPLGLGLGIFAALKKNKWQDHVISIVVMLFISIIWPFIERLVVSFAYKINERKST